MKNIWPYILPLAILWSCAPNNNNETQSTKVAENVTGYDSLLAAELGADEYGMRKYVIANLVAGPNRGQDSTTAAQLQRAHLDNIKKMAEAGKLVLAGPYLDGGDVRGIYIFAVETIEEAEELTKTDPAIQAGRLRMELRPWYGSAALMKMNDIGLKLSKKSI